MSGAPAIEAVGLVKVYGRRARARPALDGVDLAVPASSITALAGANGSGKSTLMRALVGLIRLDAGECRIFGVPAARPEAREPVGFLPEQPVYDTGARVGETLRLHAALTGAVRGAVREARERAGLREPAWRRVAACSLGARRGLGLACAFVGRPRLLILDEPTSGLDPLARARLLEQLVRFRQSGGSVLVSSHVLSELEAIADRFVVLEQGRVARAGSKREAPALAELVLGERAE